MEWLDSPDVVKNLEFDGSNARLLLKAFAGSLVTTKRVSGPESVFPERILG